MAEIKSAKKKTDYQQYEQYIFSGIAGGSVGIPDFMGYSYKLPCRERFLCIYLLPDRIYT